MAVQSLAEVDFSTLAEALYNAISNLTETSADELAVVLETHLEELQKVLESRPKSDVSRQKIKAGKIAILHHMLRVGALGFMLNVFGFRHCRIGRSRVQAQ